MNFFIRQGRALLLLAAVAVVAFGLAGCGGDDGASSGSSGGGSGSGTGSGTSTYAVVVTSAGTGASGGGNYAAGTTVSINAGTAPSGQRFKSWTVTGGGVTLADSNRAATTFTMPANAVTVKANFETGSTSTYAVVVTSAGTGASGGGNYTAGTTVSINAGTVPSGQRFKNWTVTGGGVTLANSSNAATTFTMPANAVAVTANFEAIPQGTCTSAGTCKTVTIGTQTWLAENLNIETANSGCYGYSPDSCVKYGRLYRWEAAKSACGLLGSGWHLPSQAEWRELAIAVGGTGTDGGFGTPGKMLKSTTGWNQNGSKSGNGTDDFGFSALPGGYFDGYYGGFHNAGYYGTWWTATEGNYATSAYNRAMDYRYDSVSENHDGYKDDGRSVRCVGD